MFKHILIATDGSDLARKALDHGLDLARALGAKVTVVTVTPSWASVAPGEAAIAFPVDEYIRATKENAAAILASAEAAAKRAGVPCATRHEADRFPAEGILSAAEESGCDLIVMSSHGRRGLQRFFLGSQAQEVVTSSPLPVLICR
jgi:nucleotide-binding universal stress UspA family protein